MKARIETAYGEWVDRIPAWIKWATQVTIFVALPCSHITCNITGICACL